MENRTDYSNIPPSIEKKLGQNLHNVPNHPIEILKRTIYEYFDSLENYQFRKEDELSPIVSTVDNFDKLLIPLDHPARRRSDTYYVNETTVLRTHTSAHQNQLLAEGCYNFLVTGDVYRKDEIDNCHYPVFHQMEGVGLVPDGKDPVKELLSVLGGLVNHLFPGCEYRVNEDYFPFTDPSFEIEVKYQDNWLEILGCGIMQAEIAANNSAEGTYWAFGLGLERLCMILFKIPDIRYFWSKHPRFLEQFSEGKATVTFKTYSELPSLYRDISFWISKDKLGDLPNEKGEIERKWLEENSFYELIREVSGDHDWVEKVELKDEFFHPKKEQTSRMYRIFYSPSDPSLKDPSEFTKIVQQLHTEIGKLVTEQLKVDLR